MHISRLNPAMRCRLFQPTQTNRFIRTLTSVWNRIFSCFAFLVVLSNASAADFPPGFSAETVVSGVNKMVAFDFSPNDNSIFIASKDGYVWIVKDGELLEEPFVNISEEVNEAGDRGLLGIAIHPDFPNKPFVYLLYTYDPPQLAGMAGPAGLDGRGNRVARLIRLRADKKLDFHRARGVDPDQDYRIIKRNKVRVILGSNSTFENIGDPAGDRNTLTPSCDDNGEPIQDCLPIDEVSHTIGDIRFGVDGSLFVSNGDGANFTAVSHNALRAQNLDSLAGKILRIRQKNGKAFKNNPFFDGDKHSNRSKVYDYGLRNPFRFAIHPHSNKLYIGDVGWSTWEEINTGRGVNFGWPCYEGKTGFSELQPSYANLPECQTLYGSGTEVSPPVFAYPHVSGPSSVQAGDFYLATQYPDEFQGALFYHDFNRKFIRYLSFDESGNVASDHDFADNVSGITQLRLGPDGYLYYVDLFAGSLIRINYAD